MRIYPAPHYTMGGLWVDYYLMTTIPGLFALGEANFSDHGANRLGASALMQGLADGYFVIPQHARRVPRGGEARGRQPRPGREFTAARSEVEERTALLLSINGSRSVDEIHRELGMVMLDKCGMARNEKGLTEAIEQIRVLKKEFWSNIKVPGTGEELNQELEKAGRVADLFELAELMCMDARQRNESCGGHFREEYKTEEGEARRDDENFTNVTVWEYKGEDAEPVAHTEELEFENVELTQRSYK